MPRLPSISLAAKCGWLFGAAVLLIIGTALFVPWYRTEQLVDEQNNKVARELALLALQETHAGLTATEAQREQKELMWQALRPPDYQGHPPPQLYTLTQQTDVASLKLSEFAMKSLEDFRKHRQQWDAFQLSSQADEYQYVKALRAVDSCYECHQQPQGQLPALAEGDLMGVITVSLPASATWGQLIFNRILILSAGVSAGVVAVAVFYLITTRIILRPVRHLRRVAEKISAGEVDMRSCITTRDEFEDLSLAFNHMLGRLKASREQLEEINRGLDIKLDELAQRNVSLYESNRLKNEFLANVSHELRTPLNSIIGFAEILQDRTNGDDGEQDEKTRRYCQNILTSGQMLMEFIDDLLDLAKIEAGRMEVHADSASIWQICDSMSTLLRPLAEKKRITLKMDVPVNLPLVYTDQGKLQQILYNFLSNAIKFTPARGQVVLSASLIGEELFEIRVSDTGPGIEHELQGVIFEKFRQLDGSATRSQPGTGLGLAIAKELATLLGGTIHLESNPGHGASFFVRLPLMGEGVERPSVAARSNP